MHKLLVLLLPVVLFSCGGAEAPPPTSLAPAAAPERVTYSLKMQRLAPDELFGELFRRVQMERVFADGKTFVDMVPKASAAEIMAAYEEAKGKAGFNLKSFVSQYFAPPVAPESGFTSDGSRSIEEHINALWPVLTRKAGTDEGAAGSLIPLPNDYIVPGGRFREVYYWDSYFTILGLQAAGKNELIRDMVENFAHLIDEVGHIPNGNRTYYLTRSQPPFFSYMVEVLAEVEGEAVFREFYPQLEAEYSFWMNGIEEISRDNRVVNHLVMMPDGSILNRYYDAGDRPRAESYREDVLAIRESGRDSQTVARHLRSGAESGWDYSARWFADQENIASIITTDIIPPDLNTLLFHLETLLQDYGEEGNNPYDGKAVERYVAINHHLWDAELGYYQDLNFRTGTFTNYLTLAGMYPFWAQLHPDAKAPGMVKLVKDEFLGPGGVRTSLKATGQQWDRPNGWAPLQWITYQALGYYNEKELAGELAKRWLANNERVYQNVNKMVEKYNVEDITLEAGGGEYPVQDGFGWSNGVYLKMLQEAGQ